MPESLPLEFFEEQSVSSQLNGVLYALARWMRIHPGQITKEKTDCLLAIAERAPGGNEVSALRAELETLKPLIHATALKAGVVQIDGTAWETQQ